MADDKFVGKIIDGRYAVKYKINAGNVGTVYYAIDESIQDEKAIKFIPKINADKIPNWRQEIIKVNRLKQQSGIVKFHKYDVIDIDAEQYVYIIWDYIPGESLRQMIENREITIQILIDVISRALEVFYACDKVGIHHGDFHSGNILIRDENELSFISKNREVWITDFGYGTFSNEVQPMDDYKGLARIIQQALEVIDVHSLEKDDRIKYNALKNEFPKYLLEENIVEEEYARNPQKLHEKLFQLFSDYPIQEGIEKNIGDYLAAELIGERYDEWEALFVPKFLALDDLLDRNICLLTGLRGCGKTMIFRRLSFSFQEKLGKTGIRGEDNFIGFYLNANSIAEAFPWLPEIKENEARKQVINFFHLKWIIEILTWLKSNANDEEQVNWLWLYQYFSRYYKSISYNTRSVHSSINSILECCNEEIQRCKLDDKYVESGWNFTDYGCLEEIMKMIQSHCSFAFGKSFYFFLDDYSTPLVLPAIQHILNPVIFRRNAIVYFKVSTESIESFEREGLNKKILEEGADYKLIELGTISMTQNEKDIQELINPIFEKRIKRSQMFADYGLTLQDFLGNSKFSNNDRAYKIKENAQQTLYYGLEVFCAIWSSDIRELIKIFSEMISMEGELSINEKIQKNFSEQCKPIIGIKMQDRVLREAGARFIKALPMAINPSRRANDDKVYSETYGNHLYDIVIALQDMAYFDLQEKNSKNQDKLLPKQARKIELTSAHGELSERAWDYYKGLIRYGVIIQDRRAKSVRGTIATRLYIRGLLIPYFRITFSKRDSITLEWEEFSELLENPNEFKNKYKKKAKKGDVEGQMSLKF